MKIFKQIIFTSITILFLLAGNSYRVSAAQMYDNWSQNSWIGYNYTTSGGLVFAAQKLLNSAGMSLKVPTFNVSDGYFGSNTHAALLQYQADYNLSSDGILGGETWTEL